MKRKNETVTIYFGKERICSLPFAEVNFTLEDENNYLYLEAANVEAEKGKGKREKGKGEREKGKGKKEKGEEKAPEKSEAEE